MLSLLLSFCVQISKYPGTFTEHLKLTYDKLLSIHPVKQVRKDLITNGVVIELIRLRTIHRLPWRAVIDRIIQLFGTNWPANEPSELTMIKTLSSLYKSMKNLGMFQESPFHIPCSQLDTCEYSMSRSNSKQAVKGLAAGAQKQLHWCAFFLPHRLVLHINLPGCWAVPGWS